MKILVTADVHLGFRALGKVERGINVRERDTYEAFFRVLEVVHRERPDVVFIAGDLFDSRRPSVDAYNVAFEVLSYFPPTYIVAGNHDNDSPFNRSPLRVLPRRLPNVRVFLKPGIEKVGDLTVFFLPYLENPYFEPADLLLCHVRDVRVKRYRDAIRVKNELYRFCFSGDLHMFTEVDRNFVYVGPPERFTFEQEGHPVGVCVYDTEREKLDYIELPGRKFVTLHDPPDDLQSLEGAVVRVVLQGQPSEYEWLKDLKKVALSVSVTWQKPDKQVVQEEIQISKGNLFERFEEFVSQRSFSQKAVELARTALRSAYELEQSKSH